MSAVMACIFLEFMYEGQGQSKSDVMLPSTEAYYLLKLCCTLLKTIIRIYGL